MKTKILLFAALLAAPSALLTSCMTAAGILAEAFGVTTTTTTSSSSANGYTKTTTTKTTSSSSNKNNNSNASSNAAQNERFQQELYRLRHKDWTKTFVGREGNVFTYTYRYIYYDDARRVSGYVVDLYGNIRDDYSKSIVPYYSVPKQIRELALKSLD